MMRRATCDVLAAMGMVVVLATPTIAQAQITSSGNEPIVTELEIYGSLEGERSQRLDPRRDIRLAPRQTITIEAEPIDQYGRRFPRERFRIEAELARGCSRVLSVSETYDGGLEFSAGRERGECRAVLWVPGNLNLEFVLDFEVTGLGTSSYTRNQAEEIVDRLYRAILQRDLDRASRASAVVEVQRGRVENQVTSMLSSAEFRAIREASQPADLLEAFYQGLLQRAPDSGGARDYLNDILRGRYQRAIMNLIQSPEFEAHIADRR